MKGIARLVSDPRLRQTLKDSTGIGTEATRAAVIQGLLDRGYLLRKGRSVRPSDTARMLIDAGPAAGAGPGLTAVWGRALGRVARGQLRLGAVVARQSARGAQPVAASPGATPPPAPP